MPDQFNGLASETYGPNVRRWAFRSDPATASTMMRFMGYEAPEKLLTVAGCGKRWALHLGPDEWMLCTEGNEGFSSESMTLPLLPYSAVEISDGFAGYQFNENAGRQLLSVGCPLDLHDQAFGPGTATRTLFAKSPIILWRPPASKVWRVDLPRSFSSYFENFCKRWCENRGLAENWVTTSRRFSSGMSDS